MSGILGLAYKSISVDGLDTFLDLNDLKDKSFSMYLHANPTKSYMVMPGMDTENFEVIKSHKVVEERYWALKFDNITVSGKTIDTSSYKAVIDSGTSLLVGPSSIVDKVIDGISVASNCSNLNSLPDITFTIDG